VPKFALLVARESPRMADVERDVVSEAFEVLRALGHGESDAHRLLDEAMSQKKKFKDVETLLHTVYEQRQG
jgi:Holliday junction DNA helicase RuvA